VQATLAALEAQTRMTTGSSAGASTSEAATGAQEDPLRGLEGLDEESYQALLREVRAPCFAFLPWLIYTDCC
jgi:hypothetical protein